MTSTFAKNHQKRLLFFCDFLGGFLTSKMTSKFRFDLIRPTKFGGAQSFVCKFFLVRALLMPQKFLKYIFISFCAFDQLSFGFFIFSRIFLLSAFIFMPQVFEQSALVPFAPLLCKNVHRSS